MKLKKEEKMIGFLEIPTGRLGNVMIQYAFLRQLSERIGTDYFHVKMPYCDKINNFGKVNLSLNVIFGKKWNVDKKYIEKVGITSFIEEAQQMNQRGYHIVLKPPVLGYLFEFKDENPARFFEINSQYCLPMENKQKKILVGLHFRGTDFEEWNQKASLKVDYYKKSIEKVIKEYGLENIKLCLFTDDNKFKTYNETIKFVQDMHLDYIPGDEKNAMMCDFYQLSQCDCIISSPSTFAVMAAIMGKKNKKIIHNKEWAEHCASNGESFWKSIILNEIPYYNIMCLI